MQHRLALAGSFLLLGAASLASLGCSADERIDPTSPEALLRAEPLQYGCSYVHRESTLGIGGREDETTTPRCSPERRCEDVTPPSSFHYGVGSDGYSSYDFYEDKVDFIGTCDDPHPVSCEDLTESGDECTACQARSCCAPVYLCEHDPNCVAILECLDGCKEDSACQNRCVANAEYHARSNLAAAVQCTRNTCATECGL